MAQDEDEFPPDPYEKFWPSEWPLWVWGLIYWVCAGLIITYNEAPVVAFTSLGVTWVLIFGGIYLYRFIKRMYARVAEQKELSRERRQEEKHSLSEEEMMKWNNLKNKLKE